MVADGEVVGSSVAPGADPAAPAGRLRRDILVFGAARVSSQIVAGLAAPVLAHILGPADFGLYDVVTVTFTLSVTVFAFGCDQAAIRLYFSAPSDQERRSAVSTALALPLLVSMVAAVVVVATAAPLSSWLSGDDRLIGVIRALALSVPFALGCYLTQEVLRTARRGGAYLASMLTQSLIGAAIGIALIVAFDAGVAGIYAGVAVAGLLGLALGLVVLRDLVFRGRITRHSIASVTRFGIPLIPAAISGWSVMLVDRFFVLHFTNLTEVGYYGLANKLAGLLLVLAYGFYAAWTAFALELHREDADAERQFRARVLPNYLAAAVFIGAALAANAPEAVRIFGGEAYAPAARMLPPLAMGLALYGTIHVTQIAMLARHRTRDLAVLGTAAALTNVLGCVVLVPPFGAMGASFATLIGLTVFAVSYLIRAQQIDPVDYPVGSLVLTVVLAVPVYALGALDWAPSLAHLAIKSVVVLAYLGLLIGTGILRIGELRSIARRRRSGSAGGS